MNHASNSDKAKFYKSKANYFKGVAKMRRLTACVHLEGESDKPFWSKIFKQYFPEGKFFFLSYSKAMNHQRVSGVEHCLKYTPYLSSNFFICIDSDYRYITKIREVAIKNYIFQTYTYSIENHYCFAKHIREACYNSSGIENTIFDFEKFLKEYSRIIYKLYIWHIYLLKSNKLGLPKQKFNETLTNFPRLSLENDGELMLKNLRERVDRKIEKLEARHPDIDISEQFKPFHKLGLRPENTYLYIRGHNIYDFIIHLGKMCSRELRDIKKEQVKLSPKAIDKFFRNLPSFENALIGSLARSSYPEISKISKDINYYKKRLQNHKF